MKRFDKIKDFFEYVLTGLFVLLYYPVLIFVGFTLLVVMGSVLNKWLTFVWNLMN